MNYKILTSNTASGLSSLVKSLMEAETGINYSGKWNPVGDHKVVTTLVEIQNAGNRRLYRNEYSQTMIYKDK